MPRAVLLPGPGSAAVGVKPEETVPAAADVNECIVWLAGLVSHTPTSCGLTITQILPLNDISKRCFIFLPQWTSVLFQQTGEGCMSSAEVSRTWARRMSSAMPRACATHHVVTRHTPSAGVPSALSSVRDSHLLGVPPQINLQRITCSV